MANINNAAKERVAMINAQIGLTQQQAQLEHEQNLSAIDAISAADQDIRQHGLAIQQQAFVDQAAQVKTQIDAQHQAAQAQQQHEQALQQKAFEAQTQALQQPKPPTGAI
jgi:hypothetical protein